MTCRLPPRTYTGYVPDHGAAMKRAVVAAASDGLSWPRCGPYGSGLSSCVHPDRYRLAGLAAVAVNVADRLFIPY